MKMNRLSIFLVSMLASLTALADWEVNMPRGVTPTANAAYDLHMLIFYITVCLLYTSPSPRDGLLSRMPSSA